MSRSPHSRPLPDALQRQADEAQALITAVQAGNLPATPLEPGPAPVPSLPDGVQPQVPAVPVAPQPVAPVTQDAAKLSGDLNAALGKLQAEQQRIREVEAINVNLVEQINQLRTNVARLQTAAPHQSSAPATAAATAATGSPAFTFDDELRSELGDSLAEKMENQFNQFATKLVEPLHQQARQNQQDDYQQFINEVMAEVPDLATINNLPQFAAWANVADEDGITNQTRFERAAHNRNVRRVVELYRAARAALNIHDPTAPPATAAAPATAPASRAPLEQRVAPAASTATPAPSSATEKMVKASDIRALAQKLTREAHLLSPARRIELKTQLDAMLTVQAKRPDLLIQD